jgi:hypothetical protein
MINVKKIKEMEDSKKRIKKETYTKIMEQFSRKIQVSVEAKQKQVFLEVPMFLMGYPSYSVESAALYLKRQLELSGFKVLNISPTVFNVSWYTEKEKHKEELLLPPRRREPEPPVFSDDHFPSLINLKKAAKRYA